MIAYDPPNIGVYYTEVAPFTRGMFDWLLATSADVPAMHSICRSTSFAIQLHPVKQRRQYPQGYRQPLMHAARNGGLVGAYQDRRRVARQRRLAKLHR